MSIKKITVYVVSDNTCDTALRIKRSVFRQFPDIQTRTYIYPAVRSKKKIQEIVENVQKNPGIVMYSIVKKEIALMLYNEIIKIPNATAFNVIWYSVLRVSRFLKIKPITEIQHDDHANENYFEIIDAIKFTNQHDDGVKTEDIENADIVIIGPSRVSKTPTSIYLSQQGIKVLNIPIVEMSNLPIEKLKKHKYVFGFKIHPTRLKQVREERMSVKNASEGYCSLEEINKEILFCNKIYAQIGCYSINVTSKSIEEIASKILAVYNRRN